MIVDQSSQNSVAKKPGRKNSSMRRPSSLASELSERGEGGGGARRIRAGAGGFLKVAVRVGGGGEGVAQTQAVAGARDNVAVAIEDVGAVVERVLVVEGEEFVCDGDGGVGGRRDRPQQVEGAAEFAVEDGAGHVVAGLGSAV